MIGFERKTLGDLTSSLLKNRFFGHQVPLLLEDYDLTWLVVEGIWRPAGDDAIEEFRYGNWETSRGSLTYSQLNAWLVRYDVFGNGKLKRWRTNNLIETAAFIAAVYQWCQKRWDKHQRWIMETLPLVPEKSLMFKPTDIMRTAKSFRNIGGMTARKVGRYFSSIYEMVTASEAEWRAAGLGKKDAAAVVAAIRKKYRESRRGSGVAG